MSRQSPASNPTISKTVQVEVERRPNGVAIIHLTPSSLAESSVLSGWTQLDRQLRALAGEGGLRGVVVGSRISGGWSSFFGPKAWPAMGTVHDGVDFARQLQRLAEVIETFPVPVVGTADGDCHGIGLELLLACDARIASHDGGTTFGFPLVRAGIPPSGGGTQRIATHLSPQAAYRLLVRGELLDVDGAERLGLIDQQASRVVLAEVATRRLARLNEKRAQTAGGLWQRWAAAAKQAARSLELRRQQMQAIEHERLTVERQKKALPPQRWSPSHERIALRILDVARSCVEQPARAGLEEERRLFGEALVHASTPHELFLSQAYEDLSPKAGRPLTEISQLATGVGILGAEKLGRKLARLSAEKGELTVSLVDEQPSLTQALSGLRQQVDLEAQEGQLTVRQRGLILGRIHTHTDRRALDPFSVILETRSDHHPDKLSAVKALSERLSAEGVLGSTVITRSVTELAQQCRHPEQFAGLRYSRPLGPLRLLEVITGAHSSPHTVSVLTELGRRQANLVIKVKDCPLGYSSRLTAAWIGEAVRWVAQGVNPDDVEQALLQWGFVWGPFEILEEQGLEAWTHALAVLHEDPQNPAPEAWGPKEHLSAAMARQRLTEGALGSGPWRRPGNLASFLTQITDLPRLSPDPGTLVQRCVLRLLDEALYCLSHGHLNSPQDGDVAAVLGVGFPSFRGGPFRYLEEVGAAEVLRRMDRWLNQGAAPFKSRAVLLERAQQRTRLT